MENFKFKKQFGQNFLQNKSVVKNIANLLNAQDNSLIIEVGPGSGNLSVEVASKYNNSKLLCFEIDNSLEDILAKRLVDFNNVDVKYIDFLKCDLVEEVNKYSYSNLYFISNVPYYITTPILFKLIESKLSFEKIVMMVQKEVGDRFCAKVSSKEYNALTVLLNYYFITKKEFVVDRNQFIPRPNVDSVVVSFTKRQRESLNNEEKFIKLVHDAFQFKRKTIRNNLKKYDLSIIEDVLNCYGYNLSVRAEQLNYKIFVDISNKLF